MIDLSEVNQNMIQNILHVYVSWSRYLLFFLMAWYTYLNFRYFSVDEQRKKRICGRQIRLMLYMHFIAYSVICMNTLDRATVVFYVLQVVFFLCFIYIYRALYPQSSRLLVNNMCMLLCVSLIILNRLDADRAMRQFIIAALSAAAAWLVPVVIGRARQLRRLAWLYGLLGLVLLAAVCVAGDTSFGAQLSLHVGDISVQPSEFVKLLFVFFAAGMLSRHTDLAHVAVTTAVAAAHVLILVLSRDLGSALLFFVTYLFILCAATSDWRWLGAGAVSGGAAALAAYRLFPHVRDRVLAWRDPWSDIDDKGYQVTQSLFAIGTGSWFGMGLFEGMPKKIPVVEKDFIFAAISEELGALFALCVLLICLGCFLQFVLIAVRLKDRFYKLTAFGLGVMYIAQVFLTVGGVIKFIPSTGVTLPLVSYGGSSLLSTFLLFGVIQGLYVMMDRPQTAGDVPPVPSDGESGKKEDHDKWFHNNDENGEKGDHDEVVP